MFVAVTRVLSGAKEAAEARERVHADEERALCAHMMMRLSRR